MGANQGKDFGAYYKNNDKALAKINDFEWLNEQFTEVTSDETELQSD
jgi:hypothetical protein